MNGARTRNPRSDLSTSIPLFPVNSPFPSGSRTTFCASWSLPHSSITNGSFTEMQTIASMPCALNAGATSLKRGRCVDEHVGVKAPGSEKATTFLPAKMSSVVMVAQSPLRRMRNETSGMRPPSRDTRFSAMLEAPCVDDNRHPDSCGRRVITQVNLLHWLDRLWLSVRRNGAPLPPGRRRGSGSARGASCHRGLRRAQVAERRGHRDAESLCIVDANRAQRLERVAAFDRFCDRLLAHRAPDTVDRLDHRVVDRIARHPLDERGVDLHEVHGQLLEVRERRNACAEIVEGEAAAEAAQRSHEFRGF